MKEVEEQPSATRWKAPVRQWALLLKTVRNKSSWPSGGALHRRNANGIEHYLFGTEKLNAAAPG